MSSIPEPGIQSCNTGQRMPFFDSCQLITTWMSITKIYTDSIKVCHFASANMKGWTYVRTYSVWTIFLEPKFLGCVDYHIAKHLKTLLDVFFRKLGKTYTLLITAALWIKETN